MEHQEQDYTKVQQKLEDAHACWQAIQWVEDRPITQVWDDCQVGSWLHWLVNHLCFYGNQSLDSSVFYKAEKALNARGTGKNAADRVRAVVSARTIAIAFNKFEN